MNRELKEKAITVMNNLISRPTANVFMTDFYDVTEETVNKLVAKPQNLRIILLKLVNNEYKTLYEWLIDVENYWQSIESYFGANSIYTILSRYMRNVFGKYCRVFSSVSIIHWLIETLRLRIVIEAYVQFSPGNFKDKIPDAYLTRLPINKHIKQNRHQIECLTLGLQMINYPDLINGIKQILSDDKNSLVISQESKSLRYNCLSEDTIDKIVAFVKEETAKKGLSLPS